MCDTPIAVAHEQQIEIVHSIIVSLMEEIVPGDSCPCVCEAAQRSHQITFASKSEHGQQ